MTNPSHCLRWQVVRDLGLETEELVELEEMRRQDAILQTLLKFQNSDGSFRPDKLTATSSVIQATAIALTKLEFFGFDNSMPEVERAASYLFSIQHKDGSWPCQNVDVADGEAYDMVPLQTAYPLWGLASVGYAKHPQAEKGYDWLLSKQLDDGAWPVGTASGNYGYIAGYRKLPNSRQGCRVNTICALLAFSYHEVRKKDTKIRRGLDVLLGRQTYDRYCMGYNAARCIGVEPSSGFFSYFAYHDIVIIAELVVRFGGGLQDNRIEKLVIFVNECQNPMGLWEYEKSPAVTHWLTYRLGKAIEKIEYNDSWININPSVSLNAYKKGKIRF